MTTPGVENSLSPPKMLRPLSPLERLIDAIDQTNGFNFSIAITFRGKAAHPLWIAAFAQVQRRHPFLNASLNRDDAHAPFLQHAESVPIPLTFAPRTSPTQWQRVMEAQSEARFAAAAAPLLRAVLLEDDHGCDLILTAHHTLLDGVGAISLLRDLLAALSGETLPPLSLPPSAEQRVAEARLSTPAQPAADTQAAETWQQFLASRPARVFERHTGTRRPTISSFRLSPEETAQWLRCARAQQVSLSAALLAASAASVRELNPSLKESDIRLCVPVNARPHLNNEDDAVFSISLPNVVCFHPETGLWETARALRPQLQAIQGLDAMEAYLGVVKAAMDARLDPTTLINVVAGQYGMDMTLTNLKQVDLPRPPESLTIDAVWGPAVSSIVTGGCVVGAATFNGALHLVYTSYAPLPGLLETVQAIISHACAV